MARGEAVAAGYHLSSGSLQLAVDPGSFQRGGAVEASDRYTVSATKPISKQSMRYDRSGVSKSRYTCSTPSTSAAWHAGISVPGSKLGAQC